jgi:hypothetical protein
VIKNVIDNNAENNIVEGVLIITMVLIINNNILDHVVAVVVVLNSNQIEPMKNDLTNVSVLVH